VSRLTARLAFAPRAVIYWGGFGTHVRARVSGTAQQLAEKNGDLSLFDDRDTMDKHEIDKHEIEACEKLVGDFQGGVIADGGLVKDHRAGLHASLQDGANGETHALSGQ
jgi:hypothetical protein